MTNEEYQQAQSNLMLMGQIVSQTNWNEMIDRINSAETIAPFTDPTLFRAGMDRLTHIKEMARHALRLKIAFEQLQSQVKMELEPKEYNP